MRPGVGKPELRLTDAPRATGTIGTVAEEMVGLRFSIVTLATEVTAVWYPSLTDSVAVTSASSLHVIVGVKVVVPVVVHDTPGLVGHAKVHDFVTASESGSGAVPVSRDRRPSVPTYGPPAFGIGGALCFVSTRI